MSERNLEIPTGWKFSGQHLARATEYIRVPQEKG